MFINIIKLSLLNLLKLNYGILYFFNSNYWAFMPEFSDQIITNMNVSLEAYNLSLTYRCTFQPKKET